MERWELELYAVGLATVGSWTFYPYEGERVQPEDWIWVLGLVLT